jgi:cyclopropane fatty-acyl-phospholipid synthase-like methyltransferase
MARITSERDLDEAWLRLHTSLARWLASWFPAKTGSILEVGCGRGQITVPLMELLPDVSITAVDSFLGPYSRDRVALLTRIRSAGETERVHAIKADALRWISSRSPETFDAVVSSELLPELDSKQMQGFFRNSFRVLRRGGTTTHLFLSPEARNPRQHLVIEADSDPRWSRHPPATWFSPNPRSAQRALSTAGFRTVQSATRRGGLIFTGPAARAQLKRWGVRPAFARAYGRTLREGGLELPDWVIVSGKKRY